MPIKQQPLQVAQVQSSEDILYGIEDEIEMNTIDSAVSLLDTGINVGVDYITKKREATRQQAIAEAAAQEQAEKNALVLGLTSAMEQREAKLMATAMTDEDVVSNLENYANSVGGSEVVFAAAEAQKYLDRHAQAPNTYTKVMLDTDLTRLNTEAYRLAPQHYAVVNSVINQLSGKGRGQGILEKQQERVQDAQEVIRQKEKDFFDLGVKLGVDASLWESDRGQFVTDFNKMAGIESKAAMAKHHLTFMNEDAARADQILRYNAPEMVTTSLNGIYGEFAKNHAGLAPDQYFFAAVQSGDSKAIEAAGQDLLNITNAYTSNLRGQVPGASPAAKEALVTAINTEIGARVQLLNSGTMATTLANSNKITRELTLAGDHTLQSVALINEYAGNLDLPQSANSDMLYNTLIATAVKAAGGTLQVPEGKGFPTIANQPNPARNPWGSPSGAAIPPPPPIADVAKTTNTARDVALNGGTPADVDRVRKVQADNLIKAGNNPKWNDPARQSFLMNQTILFAGDIYNQWNSALAPPVAGQPQVQAPKASQIQALTRVVNTPNFQKAYVSMSPSDRAQMQDVVGPVLQNDVNMIVRREMGTVVSKVINKGLTGSTLPVLGESPMTQQQTITAFGPGKFEEWKQMSESAPGGFLIPSLGMYATVNDLSEVQLGKDGKIRLVLKPNDRVPLTKEEEVKATYMLMDLNNTFTTRMTEIAGAYEFMYQDKNGKQNLVNYMNHEMSK